jgi:hypothetical protein
VYPGNNDCWCASETDGQHASWTCYALSQPGPTYPPPPDPHKAIRDLDDAERDAWCFWLACTGYQSTAMTPPSALVSANGYASYRCAGAGTDAPFNASFPQASVEHCKANLALSTCGAQVSDLNDCVYGLIGGQTLGCGRYLATPDCSGTIATSDAAFEGGRGGAGGQGGASSPEAYPIVCPLRVR